MNSNDLITTYYVAHRDELLAFVSSRLGDSFLAEDFVQDVFTRLLTSKKMITEVTLPSLVYTMACHHIADYYRRRSRFDEYEHYLKTTSSGSTSAESVFSVRELTERLERSLGRLPKKCGQVYRLHIYGGMKISEISDYLGEHYKSVEYRLGIARKHVRQCLKAG